MRIAIEICSAQEQEKRNRREPENCELPLALGSGFQKDVPEPVANGHDTDPWEYRIAHPCMQAKGQGTRFMKHGPKRGQIPERRGVHRIEQIVAKQDQHPGQQHGTRWHEHQARQHDHAETDGPQRSQIDQAEFKSPYRAHDNDIK
jgi:hypothetical protein